MTEENVMAKHNAIWTLCNAFQATLLCLSNNSLVKSVMSCTYHFINSDMTIANDVFLMICSILVCGWRESFSSSVEKSVNNSAAEFTSRSDLHLLIWSRRTSPGCWHTCSTRCLEGCTRDSWWWFAAGRQWKASWSHSICSSVSRSWSSGLLGTKRGQQPSMEISLNE